MNEHPKTRSLLALAGFGLATAGAAWYGSRYSPRKGKTAAWYRGLEKSSLNPPDAIFPVVWTTLFSLIAWSGWRVWKAPASFDRTRALKLWRRQLIANAAWSKLFFGRHRPDLSLTDVIALEALIINYIATTYNVDRQAAQAFIPYMVWTGFAAFLNAEIVRRNPGVVRGSREFYRAA
jgi:translocator protein